MKLPLLLKTWRHLHGFTQPQAARVIGCSRETVSQWENGHPIAPQFRPRLARALQLPSDDPLILRVQADSRPPIDAAQLAATLRAWRRTHRLTRTQAGRALRVHERTVFAWERRVQFPQPALLRRALAVLAAPPVGDLGANGWHTRARTHRDPGCSFGTQLRAWRKARGLNQLAACIALGLPRDQALISNWEKGKSLPRLERLAAIQSVIGQA
jgi:transcriptional regulator with XRE-family HTH domain